MMKKTVKVTKRNYSRGVMLIGLLLTLLAATLSYYLLVYRGSNPFPAGLPTPYPSPTPTPAYLPYFNRPASYVGTIEQINSTTEVVLIREDQSKLVLNLKPNIPIYKVMNSAGAVPNVSVITADTLSIGDTLSIYTKETSIVAIFLFNE
jgi:hypothetical protein